MTRPSTRAVGDQITARLTGFVLTTAARELVSRFAAAEQQAALPLLLDVLELEAQERHEPRIARLRRASRLPPGKTFATLDEVHLPPALVRRLHGQASKKPWPADRRPVVNDATAQDAPQSTIASVDDIPVDPRGRRRAHSPPFRRQK